MGRVGTQLRADLETVELAGHHHVQQHQVGPQGARCIQAHAAVGGFENLVVAFFERPADQPADVGLVLDDEYAHHVVTNSCVWAAVASGSHRVTTVPWPGSLRISSRPPSSSMISFTMLMPRPVPGTLPEASAR